MAQPALVKAIRRALDAAGLSTRSPSAFTNRVLLLCFHALQQRWKMDARSILYTASAGRLGFALSSPVLGLAYGLAAGGLKVLLFFFPSLKAHPSPWFEPWAEPIAVTLFLVTLWIQELAIINGDTADLDEMVRTRLSDLEEAPRQ